MLNAGFQYLEQRDANDKITKGGVVGKNSPFATSDNSGIYDIIAEDLRWLKENVDDVKDLSELEAIKQSVTDMYNEMKNDSSFGEATAKAQAEEAKKQAQAALESATNAKTYRDDVVTKSTEANDTLAEIKEYIDKAEKLVDSNKALEQSFSDYATVASNKANEASTSATNAKTSETNAATSATNAENSAVNAKLSETSAKDYASKAKISESNAKTSEVNAAASAANAKTSETNASASKSNAATSESNAKSYMDTTKGYMTKAQEALAGAQAIQSVVDTAKANAEKCLADVEAVKESLAKMITYQGSVDNYSDLPTNPQVGYSYNVKNADKEHGVNAGDNLVWNGEDWDNFGSFVDMSLFAELGKDANFNTVKATTFTGNLDGTAAKATADKYGTDIADNYVRKYVYVGEKDLNNIKRGGLYAAAANTNATAERHYPENKAGSLLVLNNGADGVDGCTQIYAVFDTHNSYKREYSVADKTWSAWRKYAFEDSTVANATTATHANDVADAAMNMTISAVVKGQTVAASGVIDELGKLTDSSDLTSMSKLRSFVGSVYGASDSDWNNVISIRHRNGAGDGQDYGMIMYSNMTKTYESIKYKKQAVGNWTGERTLLDSENYNSYAPTKTEFNTVSKQAQTQADWNSTNSSSVSFIKNVPNSLKSISSFPRFRTKSFSKTDNHGWPTYRIVEELTNYHPTNRPINYGAYGFSVIELCDIRGGNGYHQEPAFMYASLGYEYDMLQSTSSDDFPVVLHNTESDKYYVAIRTIGSSKGVNLIGTFNYPDIELGEEVLAQDGNGTPPSGWELTYKPKDMISMDSLKVGRANDALKLTTARAIDLAGDASGSATFDGSKNISINTTVNESKHAVNADSATKATQDANGLVISENYFRQHTEHIPIGTSYDDITAQGVYPNIDTGKNKVGSLNQYTTAIVVGTEWKHQLIFGTNGQICHRKATNDNIFRTVGDLAYTDSNVASATKLQTPRAITLTGDVTGSATFDGSSDVSINATRPYVVGEARRYVVGLSKLDSTKFYPIVFEPSGFILRCEIHSPNLTISKPYNQNVISFRLLSNGWQDTPYSFSIDEYKVHDQNEIAIGCIGRGKQGGYDCVWVRGGLDYFVLSNRKPILHTEDVAFEGNGLETYTVGTNYYGGTGNKNVDIIFTPQETIKEGSWHAGTAYGLFEKATKDADGNVIADTYAKKTGEGASGTWDIDVSGKAASATTATKALNVPTSDVGGNIWIS